MHEENTTLEAVPDASQLNAAGAEEAVENKTADGVDSMTLAELNALTKKNYPTKEAALKSIQDTFSYVGKKKEDIEKEVLAKVQENNKTDQLAKELEAMRIERFYDKNPQFSDPNVRKLIERIGGNPQDVVNSEEFKSIFTKVTGFDESQKLKTVLESSPRLASSRDSLSKARDLKQKGAQSEQVESLVVGAIKDVFFNK